MVWKCFRLPIGASSRLSTRYIYKLENRQSLNHRSRLSSLPFLERSRHSKKKKLVMSFFFSFVFFCLAPFRSQGYAIISLLSISDEEWREMIEHPCSPLFSGNRPTLVSSSQFNDKPWRIYLSLSFVFFIRSCVALQNNFNRSNFFLFAFLLLLLLLSNRFSLIQVSRIKQLSRSSFNSFRLN